MNEMTKTLIFCIAAFIAVGLGVATRPTTPTMDETIQEMIAKPLFPDLDDPAKAASLEITEYDENLAKLSNFEVARDSKTKAWVIPSHYNYPADADDQMRDAALALTDLKVLDVASRVKEDHELYGVVAPDDEIKASAKGVGKLAVVKDADGNSLAEVVIGKAVKGFEGNRFVRRLGQDPVYRVEIDPSKLPTKFGEWIEKDLLQANALDIETLQMRDYSVSPGLQGRLILNNRLQITADYDQTLGKWQLDEMLTFKGRTGVPTNLLDEEELNTAKLNEVKNALAQLEIVDVVRKPAGLGADLKASKSFMENDSNREDLAQRGFYVVPTGQDQYIIVSANGEVHASTKDGARYILRFGDTTGTQDEEGQLARYLFVTAEVDYSKIPQPVLQPLPIGVDAESTSPETGLDEDVKAPQNLITEGEQRKITDPDELAAERERISKENNRKVEEYNEKVAAAEKRVRELQQRFGDWYYVISDDVYKKIHLGRADIIKEREGEGVESYGVDDFRKLQDQGLQGGS